MKNGELKFSIISLSDIVTDEKVLTVVFDVNQPYHCAATDFKLDGNGLTDSLTDSISLNFVDTSVQFEYQITFCDENGEVLKSAIYHYGETVQEVDAPVKKSDMIGSYTFAGWDRPVTVCTADVIYTAIYTVEYTNYTVVFQNWDGSELSKKIYHYGDTVTIPPEPQRPEDGDYTYIFATWDREVTSCMGNITYTAVYTSVCKILYGDVNGDGKINIQDAVKLKKYLDNFNYDTETCVVEISAGADANGDGIVNEQDVVCINRYLANYDYDTGTPTVVLGPQGS